MSSVSRFVAKGFNSVSKALSHQRPPRPNARVTYSVKPTPRTYMYYSGPQSALDKHPELERLLTQSPQAPKQSTSSWGWSGMNQSDVWTPRQSKGGQQGVLRTTKGTTPRLAIKTKQTHSPNHSSFAVRSSSARSSVMMRKPGIYQASQHEKQKMEALMRAKGISYGPKTEFGVRYVRGSKYSPEEMKIENAAAGDAALELLDTGRYHGAAIIRYQSSDLLEADLPQIIKRNFYKPAGKNHYSMQLNVFGMDTKSHLLRISPTEVLMVNDITNKHTFNSLLGDL